MCMGGWGWVRLHGGLGGTVDGRQDDRKTDLHERKKGGE